MNCQWVMLFVTAHTLIVCHSSPAGEFAPQSDGIVEIEKQKLIKFPEETEQQQRQDHRPDPSLKQKKEDEAKRILEEIEKINQSLGYRKKQTEQSNRVPPILDSSQYLFPKPAYQPFHAQSHQFSGSNGEILLVPSIRAIKFDRKSASVSPSGSASAASKLLSENVSPQRQLASHPQKSQLYFRPKQVQIPGPENAAEQQQLPTTHFVIPVRLYKLNKDEYVKQFTPQQYRVNGYKIVGDIDHFYGKAKKSSKPTKHKKGIKSSSKQSSPKYHLFFLPHELTLNGDSAAPSLRSTDQANLPSSFDAGSREEKLANRPFKVQTTATSGNSAAGSNVTSSTQIVRKRIIPKPLRNKETNINSLAQQQLADGSSASSATTIHIAPQSAPNAAGPSSGSSPIGSTINSGIINAPQVPNQNKNGYSLLNNRPSIGFLMNTIRPANDNGNNNNNHNNNNFAFNNTSTMTNTTTANAIKMAFQNIFKFPFRQDPKPDNPVADESSTNLESVPLQIPQKTFPLFAQSFYPSGDVAVASPTQLPHQISTQYYDKDYKWEDENGGYNGAADAYDNDSNEEDEKQLFGHRHQQQQETQKEAIKQGGIIIQKLKVRKGGIAIAGPGGVATAGSGGTAIVGPGGYALTHPRSLTIAGPGAKVIAIPADVDLKDALQRTNLNAKSFPREGKIVATGPTVYYSPATGTTAEA